MSDSADISPTIDTPFTGNSSSNHAGPSLLSLARSVFIEWERLRIVYIVTLGAFTMMLAVPGVFYNGSQLLSMRGLLMIAEGAIVANIIYFAGPTTETYYRWLGYDRKSCRWFLFLSGTLLTAVLAIVFLSSRLISVQN